MLFFTRWKAAAILITALAVCLFAVPNFFSEKVVQRWPAWAQRHIVLGLDLQGGSSLLLEVDTNAVRKERLQAVDDDVLRVLRQARIPFTGRAIHGNSVEVHITRSSDVETALAKLRELSQPLSGILGTSGQRSVDIAENGGLITLTPSDAAITERIRQAVDQSIEIIQRRVNELGLVEPTIQREGVDRILVQVPGLQDPSRLKQILGKTAKLDFRMVDLTMTAEQAIATHPPADSEILDGENGQKYLIEKRVLVSGADLVDAQPGFDQRTNEPVVNFRFNSSGARKFAEATEKNVGKPFAIVLDNQVVSAPVIREPILGGSGQISGSFTVQQANDLAILLRAGALPAPLTIVEERTVGPGLGQDFDLGGRARRLCGRGARALLHVRDLRTVRAVRQCRGRNQRRHDLRRPVDARRHADDAGNCRHRAHGWYRGGLERADLRAHPRGGSCRPHRDQRDRCRLFPRARHHPQLQHHHLHRRGGPLLYR